MDIGALHATIMHSATAAMILTHLLINLEDVVAISDTMIVKERVFYAKISVLIAVTA